MDIEGVTVWVSRRIDQKCFGVGRPNGLEIRAYVGVECHDKSGLRSNRAHDPDLKVIA